VLTDHISIHLLQLPKLQSKKTITTEKERWIYLFKEGKNVDFENPPETLNTMEMRIVMNVLQRFSENEADYLRYQSCLEAVLKENTYLHELEKARKEREQAVKEKEQAIKEKEQLQEKLNNLQLLLKEKEIVPDDV